MSAGGSDGDGDTDATAAQTDAGGSDRRPGLLLRLSARIASGVVALSSPMATTVDSARRQFRTAPPETVATHTNVAVTAVDVDEVRSLWPGYDDLPTAQQAHTVQMLARCDALTSARRIETHNETKPGLFAMLSQAIDPNIPDNFEVAECAVGIDGGDGTTGTSELNDELGRVPLISTSSGDETLTVRAFIDSTRFNEETLDEVGLYGSNGEFINHATITSIDKTSQKVVTVEIEITYADAGS